MFRHIAGAWRLARSRVCTRTYSTGITLRPYQDECVRECLAALQRGATRIGVSSPTGSGKTTIFSELMRRIPAPPGAGRVLVLVNAVALAVQAADTVRALLPGLHVEIEQGTRYVASGLADVTVATVQSLCSRERLAKYAPEQYKCVIIDEAHHATAATYRQVIARFNGLVCSPDAEPPSPHRIPIIGFTATFSRHDGVALGNVFDEIVFHRDFFEMINEHWLAPLVFTTVRGQFDLSGAESGRGDFVTSSLARIVNQPGVNEIVVRTWLDRAWGTRRSTLVFAVNIDHANALAAEFHKRHVDARTVHSGTPLRERERVIDDFRRGAFPVLINCGILTEGADIPPIDCVLLARPTKSRNLFSQMIGRGLRLSPDTGKVNCLVLDVVGNAAHGVVCSPTLFGLENWDGIVDCTIDELRARKKREDEAKAPAEPAPVIQLPHALQYIDYTDPRQLLSAMVNPGEPLAHRHSPNAWIDCDDHRYVLCALDGSYVRVQRQYEPDGPLWHGFFVQRNPIFDAEKRGSPYLQLRKVVAAPDFAHAIRACDTFMARQLASKGMRSTLLLRSALWRRQPATARSVRAVERALSGREAPFDADDALDTLTKGDAEVILTRAHNGGRTRLLKKARRHNAAVDRHLAGSMLRRS